MTPTRLLSSVRRRVQMQGTATLDVAALTLPYEVWAHIFSYLELTVLVSRVARVNSFFYDYVSAYRYKKAFVGEFASPRGLKQLLHLRDKRLGLHVKELTFRPGPVADLLLRQATSPLTANRPLWLNRRSNLDSLYNQLDQVMSNVSSVTSFNLDYGAHEFQPSSFFSVTPLVQRGWSACLQTLTRLELNLPLFALDQLLSSESSSSESTIRFPNLTELHLLAPFHRTDIAFVHDSPLPPHPVPQRVLQFLNTHSSTIAILSIGMDVNIDAIFEGLATMPQLVELRVSHFGPGVVNHCYTYKPATKHIETFDAMTAFLAVHASQLNILHLELRPLRDQRTGTVIQTYQYPFEGVLPHDPLAKLHTLSLCFLSDPSMPISQLPLSAPDTLIHRISTSYLPSLHSLHIVGAFLPLPGFQELLGRIPIHLTNLELCCTLLSWNTFLALYKHLPGLRSLSLHYHTLEHPDMVPPNTRSLIALVMILYRSGDISNWKLEHLSVQRVGFDTPHPDFPILLKCLPNLWMPDVVLNAYSLLT
ncbi:hypothetical protein EST38_g2635 [Candolleomyces aberdarensis]|uniref:F-box domain-containing protein n=1 Tax=Candolleomyces aberdarensis TaxID=2316362 RepID=A0A4Q2DV22_9AGAR|nr:hypothetical protein EST38_g2635 [Candolleomyces aberdarensis]